MKQIIIGILLVVLLISLFNKNKENFSGIGKSFSMYYHPKSCSKCKSCYPGMYLGNDFWANNWYSNKEGFTSNNDDNIEDNINNSNSNVLTYFHLKGCPKCNKFTSEWDKIVGGGQFKTAKIEKNEMKPYHKNLGIKGFPTVILLNNNKNNGDLVMGPSAVNMITNKYLINL